MGGDTTPEIRSKTNTVAGVSLGIGILQIIMSTVFVCCCEFHVCLLHDVANPPLVSIASARMTDRLRQAYLSSVIHQDAEFFERVGPGEVGTRMIKDVGTIKAATGEKLGFMVWG